jgi:hypothetical protein
VSTRALQLDILLSGLRDPDDGTPLSGGLVYFYAAGTTTAKNVWSEKAKTNAFTYLTLDSNGSVANPYYGDGWYKIIVKDSTGATEYTWDQVYLQSNAFSAVQKTEAYTATPDDDVIFCSGTFTVSLQDVALFEHPVTIKNIGSGVITIDPYSTQTIDGSTALTLSNTNDVVILYPDTTSNVWRRSAFANDLNGQELILDADGDTSITADTDDQIDVKIGGTDQISIKDGVIEPTTDNDVDFGSASKQFKDLYIKGSLTQNGVVRKTWKSSPSAVANVTLSGLSAGKMYHLRYHLVKAAASTITVQFNEDSGNNYTTAAHVHGDDGDGAYHVQSSSDSSGSITMSLAGTARSIGEVSFYGGTSDRVSLHGGEFGWDSAALYVKTEIGGLYAGAAVLSSVTIGGSGQNITGEIYLEEID